MHRVSSLVTQGLRAELLSSGLSLEPQEGLPGRPSRPLVTLSGRRTGLLMHFENSFCKANTRDSGGP